MVDPAVISTDLANLQTERTTKFDQARSGAASGLATYSTVGIQPSYCTFACGIKAGQNCSAVCTLHEVALVTGLSGSSVYLLYRGSVCLPLDLALMLHVMVCFCGKLVFVANPACLTLKGRLAYLASICL